MSKDEEKKMRKDLNLTLIDTGINAYIKKAKQEKQQKEESKQERRKR